MVHAVPDILARIVDSKRQELPELRAHRREFERRAEGRERRDFTGALTSRSPAIIAEIKKASPSRGVLAADFDPAAIARWYQRGGAAAISVLTDREFFCGSLEDLVNARASVGIPALRKDFTIDEVHVVQAAAGGADAVLLIAALLDERELRDFRELAGSLGMAALVEVHDEHELALALDSGAEIVGVNNRDLRTFETRLETSLRLAERIPAGVVKVSESGIHSKADLQRLRDAGFNAFLVGEHLMSATNPEEALRALVS